VNRFKASVFVAFVLLALASCSSTKSQSNVQAPLQKTFKTHSFAASYRMKELVQGGPFARMVISKLGVDLIVAEGTTGESLRGGAGLTLKRLSRETSGTWRSQGHARRTRLRLK